MRNSVQRPSTRPIKMQSSIWEYSAANQTRVNTAKITLIHLHQENIAYIIKSTHVWQHYERCEMGVEISGNSIISTVEIFHQGYAACWFTCVPIHMATKKVVVAAHTDTYDITLFMF